jgi:hypothetical protein
MNEDSNPSIKEDLTEHEKELSDTELGNKGDPKFTKHQNQINWRRHAIFQAMVQGTTNTYELARAY